MAKKQEWLETIRDATMQADTYKPFFEPVIDTLADILAKRDEVQELYIKSGGKPIVAHTNKAGATNLEQNPALRLINDYNRDALTYWRELGLTPAGLKKINDGMTTRRQGGLDTILAELERG